MMFDQEHPEFPLNGGRVVAATRGPWLERILVEADGTYTWIEIPVHGGPYVPEAVIGRIREISRLAGVQALHWLRLPDLDTIASMGVFAHPRVPSGKSVFDVMMQADGWDRVVPFAAMGRRLAALHGTILSDSDATTLPRGQPPLDILGSYWSRASAGGEFSLLHRCLEMCEPFCRLVACGSKTDESPGVLLHGRWSLGALICPDAVPDDVIACGGIDMWIGPSEYDLGYLFGELMEHAAGAWLSGASADVPRIIEAIRITSTEYQRHRKLDAGLVAQFTARRILSHLIANTLWRRQEGRAPLAAREIVGLFSVAEHLLPEIERCVTLEEPCAPPGSEP